jgi:ribonuclease HII
MNKKLRLIIGVDEAGRGPLAGPITLAVFVAPQKLRGKLIKTIGGKIKDSKQFSDKRRREIYKKFLKLKKEGGITFCASHVSNKIIDNRGISEATRIGIKKSLSRKPMKCLASLTEASTRNFLARKYPCISEASAKEITIRLDGLLKAPKEFKNQKTIIGGDSKDIFIACASIVAKVRRDKLMCRLAPKYPKYKFEIHKGYGTLLHRILIKKYGFSEIHRRSYCKNLTRLSK